MIKLKQILEEDRIHEYGCVMLYFNFPEMKKIHNHIRDQHIYTEPNDDSYGLEDNPHITLLWGLHDGVTKEQVIEILVGIEFTDMYLDGFSIFDNEQYDVFKFNATGQALHDSNSKLKDLPNSNEYSEYLPHATIGYVHKEYGNKYAKFLSIIEKDTYSIAPLHIVYSIPNGTKNIINFNELC